MAPNQQPRSVVLVRHGESLWNVEHRYQGQADSGLTETGRRQAADVGRRLRDQLPTPVLVASSDSPRAYDTAAAYLEGREPDVVDPRLRELDTGTWTGHTFAEIAAAEPELIKDEQQGVDVRRGGAENFALLRDRAWTALLDLVDRTAHEGDDGPILIFTHGGLIRVAVAAALGLPSPGHRGLAAPGNCSITVLSIGPDHAARLVSYNDTATVLTAGPATV